jgi:hypothetical protein
MRHRVQSSAGQITMDTLRTGAATFEMISFQFFMSQPPIAIVFNNGSPFP